MSSDFYREMFVLGGQVKNPGQHLRSTTWATSSRQDTRFNLCGTDLARVQDILQWRGRQFGCGVPVDLALSY